MPRRNTRHDLRPSSAAAMDFMLTPCHGTRLINGRQTRFTRGVKRITTNATSLVDPTPPNAVLLGVRDR